MAHPSKMLEARMARGFLPSDTTQTELRGPVALEYIAFYMGRIDKKLDRLIEVLEKQIPQERATNEPDQFQDGP